jgi:HK97 gp10 family phage protein
MATPWVNSKRKTGAAPLKGSIAVTFTNVDEILGTFDGLKTEVEAAVRPAAQAAAQVLYDEVRSNVQKLPRNWGSNSGTQRRLYDAIYQVFSKDNSVESASGKYSRASYHVSWNHAKKRAPHGHLVEWGHMVPYQIYRDKFGDWHTKVRPSKLQEYLAGGYGGPNGKTVPKNLRPYFFVPLRVPIQVPAYPFVRPAYDAKGKEAAKRAEAVIMAAVDKVMS